MQNLVLGLDESGRGPVLGPMIIAGVLVDTSGEGKLRRLGVRDSKMIPPKRRKEMRKEIKSIALEYHSISIPAQEIDELRKRMSMNEIEAMKMAELIEMFRKQPAKIIIDLPDPIGEKFINRIRKYTKLPDDVIAEHKADDNYPVVSAASIIAKTERDRKMSLIERQTGLKLGNGYSHDPDAIAFLENHKGALPDFVRKSWMTSQRIQDKKFQKRLDDW